MDNNSNTQALQGKAPSPLQQFNRCITSGSVQDYLNQVLGSKKSSFVNNIIALVANDTKLQECKPMSLIYAGIKATALDLPLDQNLGFAYVIPYKCKTGTEAQFQMGYKGFIQLAIRTAQFRTINVTEVRDGELQDEDMLTGEIKLKRAANREELPVIGYVAFFALTSGFTKMLYMTIDEVKAHAQRYSQTYASTKDWVKASSKWTTDFDAMAKKTVLKLLLNRYAPLSVEMKNAVAADQAVIGAEGEPLAYIDAPEEQIALLKDEDRIKAGEQRKEEMRQKESTAPILL